MAVHLTKIYTRTGDDGSTGLSDFSRVAKTDSRLQAYADCDELNAVLGVAITQDVPKAVAIVLSEVQNDLFDAGADLATPLSDNPQYPPLRINESYTIRLEEHCDRFNEELPPLDSFILPGGTPAAATLHHARTVARRAERSAWAALEQHPETTSREPARYLNRLSDLLFILARVCNPDGDVLWRPGHAAGATGENVREGCQCDAQN